jgi:D-alanine-D-alanine ligase
MKKLKLAVIFGGMSTEHDISIVSGVSIIKNLNKEKYDLYPIYIDKDGNWYRYTKTIEDMQIPKVGETVSEIEKITDLVGYLKNMDCIFPVLHGLYGEDGTIQGLFELLRIPYVGCKVLASSISMDKAYTKIICEKAGLEQADYIYVREHDGKYIYVDKKFNESIYSLSDLISIIEEKIKYPMFIKPSNSGSSVGVNKATNSNELKNAIEYAVKFDKKVLIEEGIDGREVECAVLGNEDVIAGCVGEVEPADEFYSFDAKYNDIGSKITIPANISKELEEKIKNIAIKAFKAVNGKGLARIDCFIEKGTNRVLISEINTLPGFTTISMYPKLFEASGIKYEDLLDKLIDLAMEE